MNDKSRQEGNDLLNFLSDTLSDLDRFSVYNGDCLASEVYEMEELIKRARKMLNS